MLKVTSPMLSLLFSFIQIYEDGQNRIIQSLKLTQIFSPVNKYMFRVNDRNTKKICSWSTIQTPERRYSSVFIVKFEFISYIFYVFLIMTLNMYLFEKRKDSLETRVELAVVSSSVESQSILESILLYRASKCKQTKEHGSKDCLRTHIFSIL